MIKKIAQGNHVQYTNWKFICDDVADIALLPRCPFGSTVFVIHTGDTYMLDSNGVWTSITSTAPGVPGECDCVEELTIWGTLNENGTVTSQA